MASRYQNFIKGIGLVPNATDANTKKGDLNVTSGDGKLNYHNGTSSSPAVTEVHASQGTNRLQNKDLADNSTAIVDNTDTTIKIKFDAAGTTGTSTTLLSSQTADRTLTLPNATDTIVARETSDTLKNKTISGSDNTITNIPDGALSANVMLLNATQTISGNKSFGVGTLILNGGTGNTTLNASAVASGTLTLPAATDTLVGKATTDDFTNKTFDTAATGNVLKINGTQVTDVTGTGKVVLDTSPTLTTPTVDQINGATGGTLLIQSANNEDVSIQALGTGIISIGNFDINGTSIGLNVSDVISLNAKIALPLSLDSSAGSNVLLSEPATSYIGLNAAGTLVSIGGVDGTHDGEILYISNNTGSPVTILNEDTSIASSKRILTGSDDDIVLEDNASIALVYNDTESRWMIVGGTGGALTVKAVAGENITKGQSVYISTGTGSDSGRTAGRVYLLDAANDDRVEFLGIANNTVISGANVTIQVAGQVKGLSGLTAGRPVFANPTIPGGFMMTAPIAANQWIIPVGIAVTSSILSINAAGSSTAVKITSEVVDGLYADVQTYAVNTTITNANSVVLVNASAGARTITLPAPARGKIFNIKKIDSSLNAVTISPPSGTIDGEASKSLAFQWDSLMITSDGTNFFLI
jgi:hypothetical protein